MNKKGEEKVDDKYWISSHYVPKHGDQFPRCMIFSISELILSSSMQVDKISS